MRRSMSYACARGVANAPAELDRRTRKTSHAQLGLCVLSGRLRVLTESLALGVTCAALSWAAVAGGTGVACRGWLQARALPARPVVAAAALSWSFLLLASVLWAMSWRTLRLAAARCASCVAFPCDAAAALNADAQTSWPLPYRNDAGARLCAAHAYCASPGATGGVAPFGCGVTAACVAALAVALQVPPLLLAFAEEAAPPAAGAAHGPAVAPGAAALPLEVP